MDWEALSSGPGPERGVPYLYIGDIGDNDRDRDEVVVYRVKEPAEGVTETEPAEAFRLTYPDGPHDAEALMVHPKSGDLYIVTKARGSDARTGVYKAPAPLRKQGVISLRLVATLDLPDMSSFTLLVGRITGADISDDGKRVILCDYFRAWEAMLPADAVNFDSIWQSKWISFELPGRPQGEAICYQPDERGILATSEGSPFPLIEAER